MDEYGLERWEGVASAASCPPSQPMTEEEFRRVCGWDREVFGADRSRLLECLWREGPRYCALTRSGSEISGYIFGRAGENAHTIGPWVAREGSGASQELLRAAMSGLQGERVFVDICRANPASQVLIESAGFRYQRTLTRMYLGANRHPGLPNLVCSIAGPELG